MHLTFCWYFMMFSPSSNVLGPFFALTMRNHEKPISKLVLAMVYHCNNSSRHKAVVETSQWQANSPDRTGTALWVLPCSLVRVPKLEQKIIVWFSNSTGLKGGMTPKSYNLLMYIISNIYIYTVCNYTNYI